MTSAVSGAFQVSVRMRFTPAFYRSGLAVCGGLGLSCLRWSLGFASTKLPHPALCALPRLSPLLIHVNLINGKSEGSALSDEALVNVLSASSSSSTLCVALYSGLS